MPGATFWIMPSAADAAANCAWLQWKGLTVRAGECYLAPVYPRGPLEDPALLALVEARRPKFIVICLGGGVQERLGFFLRKNLSAFDVDKPQQAGGPEYLKAEGERPEAKNRKPDAGDWKSGLKDPASGVRPPASNLPSTVSALPSSDLPNLRPSDPPAIICTGAAIAFLSGQQANIPVWADRFMLGWLLRTLHEPAKYLARYWKALRLLPLLWQFGEQTVGRKTKG